MAQGAVNKNDQGNDEKKLLLLSAYENLVKELNKVLREEKKVRQEILKALSKEKLEKVLDIIQNL